MRWESPDQCSHPITGIQMEWIAMVDACWYVWEALEFEGILQKAQHGFERKTKSYKT